MAAYTTIDDPEAHFQVKTYTGTGSTLSVTLDGDTDMQPDMVWLKCRSLVKNHYLFDAVRTATEHINPNDTDVEGTDANTLTSFNSDGFTVGSSGAVNTSSSTNVAWCWKANGSGSSNTDGSINTAATSANTTAGFSINTYTGTGANATVGHGLGAIPHVVVCKSRSNSLQWFNYHQAVGNQRYMNWDDAGGRNDSDSANFWNSTTPTSTVFSIGVEDSVNGSTKTFVAYCWAPIQGFSKFGSFVGNGNTNGTFVYTGFRPAFVILKTFTRAGTDDWRLYDNKRLGYNVDNNSLMPNTTAVSRTNDDIDLLSNGFKLRNTPNDVNPNGETALYMAFAEAPFVNSNGVPCNAR
jgi:hypothetical protein